MIILTLSEIGVSQYIIKRKECSDMKKVLSVVLAIAMCTTFSMGAFALDMDDILGYYDTAKEAVEDFVSGNPVPEAGEIINEAYEKLSGIIGGSTNLGDVIELVPGVAAGDVSGIIDIITSSIDSDSLTRVIDESVDALGSLGLISGDGFDLAGIDTDLVPQFMEFVFDGLESLGIDTSGMEEYLTNSELLNFFASLYVGGGIPDTDIPQTGNSSTGIVAIAVLAIAATTTAVVCTKKKED